MLSTSYPVLSFLLLAFPLGPSEELLSFLSLVSKGFVA